MELVPEVESTLVFSLTLCEQDTSQRRRRSAAARVGDRKSSQRVSVGSYQVAI